MSLFIQTYLRYCLCKWGLLLVYFRLCSNRNASLLFTSWQFKITFCIKLYSILSFRTSNVSKKGLILTSGSFVIGVLHAYRQFEYFTQYTYMIVCYFKCRVCLICVCLLICLLGCNCLVHFWSFLLLFTWQHHLCAVLHMLWHLMQLLCNRGAILSANNFVLSFSL